MSRKSERPEVECKYCGWKWKPLVDTPKACARCKNYRWNEGPEKTEQETNE